MASGGLAEDGVSWVDIGAGPSPVYTLLANASGTPAGGVGTGVEGGDVSANGSFVEIGPRTMAVAVPFATVMTLLSLTTIFGNALVIYAVRTEKRLQTVSNYFIVSLAVSDVLIGLIVMPISTIYFVSGDWVLGLVVCQLWLCIDYVSSTASIFNLLVLSLDRYWSIRYPLKYMRKRTGKRATIMISCAWLLSVLWIVPITCWHVFFNRGLREVPDHTCDTEFGKNRPLKVATAIGNFYVPMACLFFLYAKIFHEIQKRSKMVLGRRSVGGAHKASRTASNAPSRGTELELTKVDDATWTQEYDDSISTSKDTSNETPDQVENAGASSPRSGSNSRGKARLKRPKRINSQLRNISNLTLLTVGLGGMVDPEAVRRSAAKGPTGFSLARGGCTRSPCCHHPEPRMKETQFLSPGDALSRKLDPNVPRSRPNSTAPSGTPSPDRDGESEDHGPPRTARTLRAQNGSRKSILRRNSAVDGGEEPVSNGTLSSRKISFSTEDLPGRSRASPRIGCMPSKKRLTAEYQDLTRQSERGGRSGRGENRHRRNGVTSRLLSVEYRLETGPGGADQDEDSPPPGGQSGANPRSKFSLSRFSMRPGRATETLKRIRKMSLSKERKAAKQLGVIVGCFICCWATYMVFFMIVAFCSDCINADVYLGSIWLGYINSTLNPVIYPMCNSTFRKAFKKILRIKKR